MEEWMRCRNEVIARSYTPAMAPPPPPPPPAPDYGYSPPFCAPYDCYQQYPTPPQPFASSSSTSTWSPHMSPYSPPPPSYGCYPPSSDEPLLLPPMYNHQQQWQYQSAPPPQQLSMVSPHYQQQYETPPTPQQQYETPPTLPQPLQQQCQSLQQQEETEPKMFDEMPVKKLGSKSWCRRCKIECESMEGLVIHSLTSDHQNRTLTLVRSIKQSMIMALDNEDVMERSQQPEADTLVTDEYADLEDAKICDMGGNERKEDFTLVVDDHLVQNMLVIPPDNMATDGPMHPGSVVGTDFHTTMIEGLEVFGGEASGTEAVVTMLGQPVSMVLSSVLGIKLSEFYGHDMEEMTVADRSTSAKITPEHGAAGLHCIRLMSATKAVDTRESGDPVSLRKVVWDPGPVLFIGVSRDRNITAEVTESPHILSQAEERLLKSLRVSCRLNHAVYCLKRKDFQETIKLSSKILDIKFCHVKAIYKRAKAYMEAGDLVLTKSVMVWDPGGISWSADPLVQSGQPGSVQYEFNYFNMNLVQFSIRLIPSIQLRLIPSIQLVQVHSSRSTIQTSVSVVQYHVSEFQIKFFFCYSRLSKNRTSTCQCNFQCKKDMVEVLAKLPLEFPDGTTPVTCHVSIYDNSSLDSKVGVGSLMDKATVPPLPTSSLYMEVVHAKLGEGLQFTIGGQHIPFGPDDATWIHYEKLIKECPYFDQLAEKMTSSGLKAVRLCAKSREVAIIHIEHLTLYYQVQHIDASERSELHKLRHMQVEQGELSSNGEKKFKALKRATEREILQSVDVICCTCIDVGDPRLSNFQFHQVLIDDSTQTTEPECLIPLVLGVKQIVLVGDQCQLGPIPLFHIIITSGSSEQLDSVDKFVLQCLAFYQKEITDLLSDCFGACIISMVGRLPAAWQLYKAQEKLDCEASRYAWDPGIKLFFL